MTIQPLICLLFVSAFAAGLPNNRPIHEFEDGFVERSMAIVVRGKTVHLEYSIGLNETTARSVLTNWEASSTERDRPATAPNHPAEPDSKTAKPDPVVTQAQPAEPEAQANSAGHVIAPELMKNLKQLAPTSIPRRITIQCNGKPVEVVESKLGPPPRHPFTLTVKLQFELPDSKICELQILDQNFSGQTGAFKHAAKATGSAMILQSNVAPILVRADRIELADEASNELPAINLRLGFVPTADK